jgi:RNA polymerase sigma factor (sigma-70 family)
MESAKPRDLYETSGSGMLKNPTMPMNSEGSASEHPGDWEAFYESEMPRLWRSLYVYAQSAEIASDATAEAFARSYVSWDAVRDPVPWVFRVGFRVAAKELRHRSQMSHVIPEEATWNLDSRIELVSALSHLSPSQRGAVLLSDYYGFTSREVAGILHCAPSTARVHIARARRSLRRLLHEQQEEAEES